MGSNIFLLYFFGALLFSLKLEASFSNTGRDHGFLTKKHVQVAEDFVEDQLKINGKFNRLKILKFVKFLEAERERVKNDIYETEILERVELLMKSYKKSEKKSKKKVLEGKSGILKGFDLFLIPKMKLVLNSVDRGENEEIQTALVHDFIRGYVSYFAPNTHRNMWPRDLDLTKNIKKVFKRYEIPRVDEKSSIASNLVVDELNSKRISSCLRDEKKNGDYLSSEELEKLKKCDFDLSLLNPGVSSLWSPVTDKTLEDIRSEPKGTYPTKEDTLYFEEVTLRGHQSPKIKVSFTRGDETFKLKFKMGYEVHTDTALSTIAKLAGLNQDSMKRYHHLKVYLGDTSYNDFCSQLANKYGVESIVRYITAYGDDEKGTWVLFHDIVLEARDNGEIRIGPLDISSWDLGNRREYRGLLLFWAWLGIQNAKPANFKLLLRETESGLVPLHRMHDLGTALGAPFSLRNLNNILGLLETEDTNLFPENFIKLDKKEEAVKILWNDVSQFSRNFKYTTWNDLKWMARNIINIKKEDLRRAFEISGMPKEVTDVYMFKLGKRRNQIIESFGLEDEFEKEDLPKKKDFNLKDKDGNLVIKKGKLVKKVYKDTNSLPVSAENWVTFLTKLLSFDISIKEWTRSKTKNTFALGTTGVIGLKASMGVKDPDVLPFALTTLPLSPGIEAILSRNVSVNEQMMNDNKKFHIYKVVDRIKIKFAIESPLLKKIISKTNIADIDASLKFFEYEFQFVHFEDTVKKAYLGKFNLPKILAKPLKYAALEMKPLEIISTYQRVGFDFEGDIRVFSMKPGIRNQVALTFGGGKSKRKYIMRDQFGQLHVYKDTLKNAYAGFALGIAELDLFFVELPFFRIELSVHRYKTKIVDYIFPLETHDRRYVEQVLSKSRRREEYAALKSFEKRKKDDKLPEIMKLNYQMIGSGKQSTFGIGAAFLFNRLKKKEESSVKLQLPSGKKKEFYRYSQMKAKSLGLDSDALPLLDMLVSKRKKTHIVIESNLEKTNDSVLAIRIQDYFRVRTPKELTRMITDLNRRYSESLDKPFYRGHALPDEKFVEKYRKVYGLTRAYLDPKKLGKKIQLQSDRDLKILLKKHFWDSQFEFQNKPIKSVRRGQRLRLGFKKYRAMKLLRRIKSHYKETFGTKNTDYLKYYVKLIDRLKVEEYGFNFLSSLLPKKSLLVFGEIAGVIPSFSTLQDLQTLQRRRFAGKHWGSFNRSLPIQKYLRKQRILPILIHTERNVSDSLLFGDLESAVAPNLEPLLGHATNF